MEHIRQYDWCSSQPDNHFLDENDMDNCAIEKIIRNKFYDPMISSDSEDEQPKQKIDWSEVFVKQDGLDNRRRLFVAGLKTPPKFPKLSALTRQQHYTLLKIICAENPNVLSLEFMQRPNKSDHNTFEKLKDTYLKEQQEFIEWAKTLWTNKHCLNALRPKPTIEMMYEAEFKMKATAMASFPKHYEMAAQISLDNASHKCDMIFKQDIINVSLWNIPKIQTPELAMRRCQILRPSPVPEPCDQHPCWFVLPNEKTTTVLPLTEIHKVLAQFALDNGSKCISSEGALKCLVETDRHWSLPLTVFECVTVDGDKENVIVFGSEFSIRKKCAMSRTYSAYRHLLEYALIPASEKNRISKRLNGEEKPIADLSSMFEDIMTSDEDNEDQLVINDDNDKKMSILSDSEDENDLIIDEAPTEQSSTPEIMPQSPRTNNLSEEKANEDKISGIKTPENKKPKKINHYNCTCMDTSFERPPPRSFRRWQVRNFASSQNIRSIDLIVYCSHKMKSQDGEVIAEPIPEYQIDLAGSNQSEDKIKSVALSLHLRKNATLLNVRIDGNTGDLVTIDKISKDEFMKSHLNIMHPVANILYESIDQLQGLMPGHYILQHEPGHGTNALLYASRAMNSCDKLTLDFNMDLTEADEAKSVKNPPVLTPVLLPFHKFRRILPCAFTPYEDMLAKETKKPPPPPKPKPPKALQWPKRKRKNRAKN